MSYVSNLNTIRRRRRRGHEAMASTLMVSRHSGTTGTSTEGSMGSCIRGRSPIMTRYRTRNAAINNNGDDLIRTGTDNVTNTDTNTNSQIQPTNNSNPDNNNNNNVSLFLNYLDTVYNRNRRHTITQSRSPSPYNNRSTRSRSPDDAATPTSSRSGSNNWGINYRLYRTETRPILTLPTFPSYNHNQSECSNNDEGSRFLNYLDKFGKDLDIADEHGLDTNEVTSIVSYNTAKIYNPCLTYRRYQSMVYVYGAHSTIPFGIPPEELKRLDLEEEKKEINLECKICFDKKINVAIVPCGHVVCRACSLKITNNECPYCLKNITKKIGLFLN